MNDRAEHSSRPRATIFVDENCAACGQALKVMERVRDSRKDFDLDIFRRGSDRAEFARYGVVICPALFVQGNFFGYGTPDIARLEKALDAVNLRRSPNSAEEVTGKDTRQGKR